jgi:hypothetical protein
VARNVATLVPSPETPVAIGKPVALVKVPDAGVPKTGAVKIGLVKVLFVRVAVPVSELNVRTVAPSPTSIWLLVESQAMRPSVVDVVVERVSAGVVIVGVVPNTKDPLPVSFEIIPAS